jgi:hypothetical protein
MGSLVKGENHSREKRPNTAWKDFQRLFRIHLK